MDTILLTLIVLTFVNSVVLIIVVSVATVLVAWFFVRFNRSLIEISILLAEVTELVKLSKLAIERIEWRS